MAAAVLGRIVFVALVHRQITGNSPLGAADALCSLIELSGHVQVANLGFATVNGIENNERVDLEVSEMEVDVDAVEADKEVDEGVLLLGRHVGKEGGGDGLARREGLGDGEVEDERLGVNIADVNTTLVGEEDGIAFTGRGDADVVFGVGRMGEEWFDNEVVQGSSNRFHLQVNILSITCVNLTTRRCHRQQDRLAAVARRGQAMQDRGSLAR